MSNNRAGHIYIRVSTVDEDQSDFYVAWYLYRIASYNQGFVQTLADSGGDTGQFTIAITDNGDLDADSLELVVSATGPVGNGSINLEVIATNYAGIREAWRE
jgi:hypothetical protein